MSLWYHDGAMDAFNQPLVGSALIVYLIIAEEWDYDEHSYTIHGVYLSYADAQEALINRGFRIYKSGPAKGNWSKRSWAGSSGLEIQEFPMGWQDV